MIQIPSFDPYVFSPRKFSQSLIKKLCGMNLNCEWSLIFRKYRLCSSGTIVPELDSIATLLVNYRNACLDLQKGDENKFIDYCYLTWGALSDDTLNIPYKLPKQYVGKEIKDLFNHIFKRLFSIERINTKMGGNLVLNGVKGVGKTTVLAITGAIAACLTDKLLPVYWIYEGSEHCRMLVRIL